MTLSNARHYAELKKEVIAQAYLYRTIRQDEEALVLLYDELIRLEATLAKLDAKAK